MESEEPSVFIMKEKNAIGLEAGSNIVFINDIFQTPNTSNNVETTTLLVNLQESQA